MTYPLLLELMVRLRATCPDSWDPVTGADEDTDDDADDVWWCWWCCWSL